MFSIVRKINILLSKNYSVAVNIIGQYYPSLINYFTQELQILFERKTLLSTISYTFEV